MKRYLRIFFISGISFAIISCNNPAKDSSQKLMQTTSVMKMQFEMLGNGSPIVLVPGARGIKKLSE